LTRSDFDVYTSYTLVSLYALEGLFQMVEPSVAFRRQIQGYQKDIQEIRASMYDAQALIDRERDIGAGQCARIIKSIQSAEEPLHKFSALLDAPDQLPLSVRSVRHPLLILLDNAQRLLHNLIYDVDELHVVCRNSSYRDANIHREHILRQLNVFEQKSEALVQDIDRLLFASR
jgi:hypothetical protein